MKKKFQRKKTKNQEYLNQLVTGVNWDFYYEINSNKKSKFRNQISPDSPEAIKYLEAMSHF